MFQINDLANNVFKYPVCATIATDKVDSKGDAVIAKAHFVGRFRSLSLDEQQKQSEEINELPQLDMAALQRITIEHLTKVFIGFEKHPGHAFPFKDGEADLASTPENIQLLLQNQSVLEAVRDTYKVGVSGNVSTKNSRK